MIFLLQHVGVKYISICISVLTHPKNLLSKEYRKKKNRKEIFYAQKDNVEKKARIPKVSVVILYTARLHFILAFSLISTASVYFFTMF